MVIKKMKLREEGIVLVQQGPEKFELQLPPILASSTKVAFQPKLPYPNLTPGEGGNTSPPPLHLSFGS